jgi:hypothetical protein
LLTLATTTVAEGVTNAFPESTIISRKRTIMRPSIVIVALIGLCQCRNDQQPIALAPAGIEQPLIGFGTWNLKESPENTTDVVAVAIESGYRQIDCAAAYGNEKEVGQGISKGLKNAGIRREDIWVTSKLWNDQYVPSSYALFHELNIVAMNPLVSKQP